MARNFSEPWEPEDVFEHAAAAEHRRGMAELIEQAEAVRRVEKAQEEKHAAEMSAKNIARGERMIRAEYEAHGIEPPPGTLVSLSMLKRLGWTIEELPNGSRALCRPAPHIPGRNREDYGT